MMSAQGTSSSGDLAHLRARLQRLRQVLAGISGPEGEGGLIPEEKGDAAGGRQQAAPAAGQAEVVPLPAARGEARRAREEAASESDRRAAAQQDVDKVAEPALASAPAAAAPVPSGRVCDADRQEVRRRMEFLLGFASRPQNLMSPQDRRLALDLLSVMLPLAGECMCSVLIERLLVMEAPPRALLAAVLEHASPQDRRRLAEEARLPDDLLQDLARDGDEELLQGIARRRHLPACATWELARHAPTEVVRAMLRNGGAVMTETSWWHLLRRAQREDALHTPLATRADLPRHVALELFWYVGPEQRRHIISRFASDSQQLETLLAQAQPEGLMSDVDFLVHLHVVMGALGRGDWTQAGELLAEKTGLSGELCRRLLEDAGGEALAVLLKAHGVSTRDFVALLESMQKHRMASRWPFLAQPAQVEALYGTVSINRARMMLLYWDWRCRGIGPYRDLQAVCAGGKGRVETAARQN